MRTLALKFTLSALALLLFVSSYAIEQPARYFAPPIGVHSARMKFYSSVHGKKKHKRSKHKVNNTHTCDAY
ncbi:MAG TPA: hypothetical protein VL651_12115 [Bacteroidia bacterium]|jgi:hypothetical protein|nr:hypothetical protein [Bacteroidia bacterium]